MTLQTMTLGWSRTKVRIDEAGLILDVGCGAFPNDAATISCDMSLDEDRHRTGRSTTIDRPFVLGDASKLPFRDNAFDFVIASHIGEHVNDPATFCAELARVASRGYIETPSRLADYLLDEEYHQWRVGARGGRVIFARKPEKGRFARWWTDRFYRCFYAGREMGASTYRLPRGPLGRLSRYLLYLVRGTLNRVGVMHTRVHFGPDQPLVCEVVGGDGLSRSVVIVERGPSSGFLNGDRQALDRTSNTTIVSYPGWPSPSFLWTLWRATGRSGSSYTFFASEHAVFAGLIARVRRRRFVVAVGGYDVASVPEHRYGLPTRRRTRWVPKLAMRWADSVLAMSEAALDESIAAGADPRRTEVLRLGVDDRWALPSPGTVRDPDQVVTVGYVDSVSWSRKGIDRFVDLARRDPDRRYLLVGRITDDVRRAHLSDPPSNLQLCGFVDDEGLRRLLWSSGTYVQLSWHEGFGVSMVEAMMAGCRPVVSGVPALVEVAGDWAVVSVAPPADLEAVGRAAEEPIDRVAMARWACQIASVGAREEGLARVLFGEGSPTPDSADLAVVVASGA